MFRVHREPTIVIGQAPAYECGLRKFRDGVQTATLPKHIGIIADGLYTLKDSNIFHVSGSLFRMLLMLYELQDHGITSTLYLPDSWNTVCTCTCMHDLPRDVFQYQD